MRLVHYTVQRTPHKVVQEEWWKNKSVADDPINPKMNLKEDETETYMKKTTTVIQEGNGAFVVKEELEKECYPPSKDVYVEKPGYFYSLAKEDVSKWKMLSPEMHSKVQKMIPLKIRSLEPQ